MNLNGDIWVSRERVSSVISVRSLRDVQNTCDTCTRQVCTNLLTYNITAVVPAAVPVAAAASTLTIRGASFFNSGALKCRLTSVSTGACQCAERRAAGRLSRAISRVEYLADFEQRAASKSGNISVLTGAWGLLSPGGRRS